MNSIDIGPRVSKLALYLLELSHLDPGFSESQYTTLIHHPIKHAGLHHFISEITCKIKTNQKV